MLISILLGKFTIDLRSDPELLNTLESVYIGKNMKAKMYRNR